PDRGPARGAGAARRRVASEDGRAGRVDEQPIAAAPLFAYARSCVGGGARAGREGTIGHHGKSSLAARAAHRLHEPVLAVVFGRYDALGILDAVKRYVVRTEVEAIVRYHRAAVREVVSIGAGATWYRHSEEPTSTAHTTLGVIVAGEL